MAEDKADTALNQAYLTKTYYSGNGPEESGYVLTDIQRLDDEHMPWLYKWYTNDGICHQFVDSCKVYREIIHKIEPLLEVAFVNEKQRLAMNSMIDRILMESLTNDRAHDGDTVI